MQCKYCTKPCIKKGLYQTVQKLYCKTCKKHQRVRYAYKLITQTDDHNIALLTKESMSINSIARYLNIAKTTVCRRLLKIGKMIQPPLFTETSQVYEVDEMYVMIAQKEASQTYLSYAINKHSKAVIDFAVGGRSKAIINRVVQSILKLNPKKIYTIS